MASVPRSRFDVAALTPLRALDGGLDCPAALGLVGAELRLQRRLRCAGVLGRRLEATLAALMPRFGLGRQGLPSHVLRECALRAAETLRQHDVARTDDVAAAALDAVVEP